LKSMREASGGDPMFDSNEGGLYRDMFDDQIAVDMSRKGSMGLADLLVRQLSKAGMPAAAEASDATNKPESEPERDNFVQKMWPLAVAAGRILGIDPRHVIAQAALETGWGQSAPGNNFFGIKAGAAWRGPAEVLATQEFVHGAPQTATAPFRVYANASASVQDYVSMLGTLNRYAGVRGTGSDTAAFAQALRDAGYATDPDYAVKLQAVVQSVDATLQATVKSGTELPITLSTGSL
jgi:peptidoglycan hydrolase FlgJ